MSLRVVSPYSGELVRELTWDFDFELDTKLDRARAAFALWRAVPLVQRTREVHSALEWFRANAEEVARDVTLQMGKPIVEARAELATMLLRAQHLVSIAESSLAPDVPESQPGTHRRIEHEPLGVVLDIAAWNYPLLVPINVVVPALLAGNAVLLKHSPLTPLCGLHFERAFASLSVPHVLQSVVVENDRAEKLVGDRRVDHVVFTGSVATGRKVYRAAAERLIDVGLELGGKDAAYVAEDADLDFAAVNVVEGACYNAGQSCCAVERAYVHESLYEPFLARAKVAMEAYRLGDPLDPWTTLGPVARRDSVGFLARQVEDAVARGAKLLVGGRRVRSSPDRGHGTPVDRRLNAPSFSGGKMLSTSALFFEPTLLSDVPNDAFVMQEESFGPILPVAKVSSDEEAVARMNDSRYGLTASVWTRSRERVERLASVLEAGTVFQNRCDYVDPALPWTGCKESGIGSTLSRYGFLHLTRRKSLHFRE